MKIDLNADLGEGCASDAELLTLVSSANIACGFHAGDAQIMQACVREAIKNGVAIGAHPSFPDRENFGRSAMQLPPETVYAQTLYQIGALATIARAQGGVMRHVKPHGMLYNQAAKEAQLADAIARAVYACDPALILVGLAGSELIRAGKQYGLTTREEVFADRGYQADGSLVPRSQSGALIENEEQALAQTLEMVQHGRVKSITGEWATVAAQTVCLHGDGEHALAFARRLRSTFAGTVGCLLRLPSGTMLIPMLAGAVLQSGQLITIELPEWLLAMAYMAIGWRIGLGFDKQILLRALRPLPQILLSIFALLAICAGMAWGLTRFMHIDFMTAYLATSPGGLDTVAVIAAGSNANMALIMAMQSLRLFSILLTGPAIARFISTYAPKRSA